MEKLFGYINEIGIRYEFFGNTDIFGKVDFPCRVEIQHGRRHYTLTINESPGWDWVLDMPYPQLVEGYAPPKVREQAMDILGVSCWVLPESPKKEGFQGWEF